MWLLSQADIQEEKSPRADIIILWFLAKDCAWFYVQNPMSTMETGMDFVTIYDL